MGGLMMKQLYRPQATNNQRLQSLISGLFYYYYFTNMITFYYLFFLLTFFKDQIAF